MTQHNTAKPQHGYRPANYGLVMRFGVLGPVQVTDETGRVSIGGPKQKTVLALLIAHAGTPVPTDALVQGVYGDDASPRARRSVQTYVSNLRSQLGDAIKRTGSGYELIADRSEIDAAVFDDTVVAAANAADPEEKATRLREALALWRGHPYADVDGGSSITTEIGRLAELRAQALEARVDADLELGRHRSLISELDSLTEEYPLRERFRAQQMLALYRCGRQAEALRAYERTRNFLVEEMGLDPSPELRRLEQRILEQDPELAAGVGPTVRTVAILVADVADPRSLSTQDPDGREALIAGQTAAVTEAVDAIGGSVYAHRGSAMYAVFDTVNEAVTAAVASQQRLVAEQLPMRIGVATGEVQIPRDGSIQGPPVTRAAQLVAAGHEGQVLLSPEANQALFEGGEAGWIVRSLGQHDLDGSGEQRAVYQLVIEGVQRDFPPLRSEALPPPLPLDVRGLPGYELREQVGSGAFGVVHRAYQPSVGREVAVKIIRPEFANESEFIRHFEVEAQLVARLEHPHIVPLHDYWRSPEGAYLVMRWLRGGSLHDRIASGPITIAEADALLNQIGPALAFAHRHGVVHRDLKPSNILLDEDGSAYLTDFGIARLRRTEPGSVTADVHGLASTVAMALHGTTGDPNVDSLLTSATSGDPPFPDVASFMDAWADVVGSEAGTAPAATYTQVRNPYKGLRAFDELDADDFFGRDGEVAEVVDTLDSHRFVAVVGPSGIGKSSVVRAGVLPALRNGVIEGSGGWLITDMKPGSYPYEELTAALMRVSVTPPTQVDRELRESERGLAQYVRRYLPEGSTLLLVVDQFEELFTLATEAERDEFLAMLAATVGDVRSRVRVLITMRADFFDRPLRFAELGEALREGTVPIAAPDREALALMVSEPASGVGVGYEPGLTDRIVADVYDQPGALPLLQYALAELFESRSSDTVTSGDYAANGGVVGALAARAEAIYSGFDESQQGAARQLLLRLVRVSEGGRATRRRVNRTSLDTLGIAPADVTTVLDAFSEYRLVTYDKDDISRIPTIEVAHEALLSEWPRLAGWITELQQDLLLHGRLASAVADWESADRGDEFLLTGGRLTQHENWVGESDFQLTERERAFLATSRAAEDATRSKRRRTRNVVTAGFGIAAVVGLSLAVFAMTARSDLRERTVEAETAAAEAEASEARAQLSAEQADRQRALAEARALIASSRVAIESDPELALMLALVGVTDLPDDPDAVAAVRAAKSESRTIYRYEPQTDGRGTNVAIDPSGQVILVAEAPGTRVDARDLETNQLLWSYELDAADGEDIRLWMYYMNGGSEIAVVSSWGIPVQTVLQRAPFDTSVRILDAATGEPLRSIGRRPCGYHWNQYAVTDRYIVLSFMSAIHLAEFGCMPSAEDSHTIDFRILDTRSGAVVPLLTEVHTDLLAPAPFVTLSSDGGTALAYTQQAGIEVFDVESGETLLALPDELTQSVALSPDASLAVFGGSFQNNSEVPGRVLRVYDVATGQVVSLLPGHAGGTRWAGFTPDGTRLVTTGVDASVKIWDPRSGLELDDIRSGDGVKVEASMSADSTKMALGVEAGSPTVVNLDPAAAADVGAFGPCSGPSTFFNKNGLRVRGERVLVRASCDGLITNPNFVYDTLSFADVGIGTASTGQSADLSADGTLVAGQWEEGAGGDDWRAGTVWIERLVDGEVLSTMDGLCEWGFGEDGLPVGEDCTEGAEGSNPVYTWDIEFSPDGTRLAMAPWFGPLGRLWDAKTGDTIAAFPAANTEFYPDSTQLLVIDEVTRTLARRNAVDGAVLGSAPIPEDSIVVAEPRFHPSGGTFVAWAFGGATSDIAFFDGVTLQEIDRISGAHQAEIRDFAVSEDGNLLASAGADGIVRIWDFDSRELVHTIPVAKDTNVQGVSFANDDRHVMVTVPTGPVLVYTLDSEELIASARGQVTRGFTHTECNIYFDGTHCPTFAELTGTGT